MKHAALALVMLLVVPALARCEILYWDNFDHDTLGNYTQDCYASGVDTATWQIVNATLKGTSSSAGQCYAGIMGHPTWSISEVWFRIRTADGQAKGINIHNARGNISLTMSNSPDDRLVLRYGNEPGYTRTVMYSHFPSGTWLTFYVRFMSGDIDLYINGDWVVHTPGDPVMWAAPFQDVRFWVANSSTAEFDDITIFGSGVSPADGISWGSLKSVYR